MEVEPARAGSHDTHSTLVKLLRCMPPSLNNIHFHQTDNSQLATQLVVLIDRQAVVVSVLPIVPAYIVCWPWALVLVFHGRWVVGVLLAVTQHTILSAIDTELCTQVQSCRVHQRGELYSGMVYVVVDAIVGISRMM